MAEALTRSTFADRYELPDWRILGFDLAGRFRFASYPQAAAFVQRVGETAESLDHHPNVSLRYPGIVEITMTSHDANGLTSRDARLAAELSKLATDLGGTAHPEGVQRVDLAIDALDIPAVLPFWKAVLGYIDGPIRRDDGIADELVDPLGIDPPLWFQQMDGMRPQRNRMHLDICVPPETAEARIAAAIGAGGRLSNDSFARAFWVLADPEGNEVCVCTWQDRD
jgi:4a-hydroxytetrahydrobiopterin dehydratase